MEHEDENDDRCEVVESEHIHKFFGVDAVRNEDEEGAQEEHEYLYWEFYEKGGKKAARWGDWKAIQTGINQNPNAPIEIYNLSEDLREENNLAESQPELVERAREIFKEAHTPSPNWTFGKPKAKGKKKP